VRQRFVEESLESALTPHARHSLRLRKMDGEAEAHLIAIACSQAPAGASCWKLRMLADKMVVLGDVESISHESVRQVLKKTSLNLG
jgi:Homeodomain-like domain